MALAAPRIREENHLMIGAMLDWVKVEAIAATPLGPGHFGYHLKESFSTDIEERGLKTVGVLKSPPTGYWREFGTKGRFRRSALLTQGKGRSARLLESFGGQGERAFMTAHKALNGARRIIRNFYNGKALWWRV